MKNTSNHLLTLALIAILVVSYRWPRLTAVWGYFEHPYYLLITVGMIGAVGCSIVGLAYQARTLRLTWVDGAVLMLLFYLVLATSVRHPVMFGGLSWATLLALTIVYLLARQLTAYRSLFLAISLFGGLAAVHGIAQYLGWAAHPGPYPVTGFFNNPAPYAGVLAATLPVTLILLRKTHRRWSTYLCGIVLFSTVVAVLLSQSRAALVAGVVSIGWVGLSGSQLLSRRPPPRTAAGVVLLLTAGLLLLVGLAVGRPASVQGRLLIYRVVGTMLADAPLFGVGFGRFGVVYSDYQAAYLAAHPEAPYRQLAGMTYYAFNEPLQLATALGLVGMAFVILMAVAAFVGARNSVESSAARILLVAVAIFGLFSYPLGVQSVSVLIAVALATLASSSQLPSGQIPLNKTKMVGIGVIGLLASGWFSIHQYQRYRAVQTWKAAASQVSDDPVAAFVQYQRVYPALAWHGDFLFNYGAELVEAGRYQEALLRLNEAQRWFNHVDLWMYRGRAQQALGHYAQAEADYRHAAHMIPHRFYPHYLLTSLYEVTGDTAAAYATAQEVLSIPVKVPSQTVSNIQSAMRALISRYDSASNRSTTPASPARR